MLASAPWFCWGAGMASQQARPGPQVGGASLPLPAWAAVRVPFSNAVGALDLPGIGLPGAGPALSAWAPAEPLKAALPGLDGAAAIPAASVAAPPGGGAESQAGPSGIAALSQAGSVSGVALEPGPAESSSLSASAVFDGVDRAATTLASPDVVGAEASPAAPAGARPRPEAGGLLRPAAPADAGPGTPAVEKADEAERLGMQGMRRRWEKLYLSGQELQELGRGAFGAVYAHPRIKGAVIKMVALSAATVFAFGGSDVKVAMQDYQVGRAVAEAGVGPKVLGVVSVPGEPSRLRRWLWGLVGREARVADRPAVVKERIFGETVEDLIAARRFTAKEYDLVQEMLGRMADARLRVWDLRTANVMIGTTADDPAPRAYIVDAGWLLPVKDAETRAELLESLKRQQTVIMEVGGGSANWAGPERGLDPFDDILRKGLR